MRRTVLASAIAVLAVLSVGGSALAQTASASAPSLSASASPATVRSYLRSIGVDPRGVVVQRGARNFAGADCPGEGWSCTTATKVLQITDGGVNISRCSATGGPASITRTSSGANVSCLIVQSSTSGANTAVCDQISVTGVPGSAIQKCAITQMSVSGANTASVDQALVQGPICLPVAFGPSADQTQLARQEATIHQSSTSGAGAASVDQNTVQCAARLTSSTVGQSQTTYQEFAIVQAPQGFNPGSPSCPGVSGALRAAAGQKQLQIGYAPKATGGTQAQQADLIGHVDQCSSGLAEYSVLQAEDQRLIAPIVVAQTQVGPFRCCSFQGFFGRHLHHHPDREAVGQRQRSPDGVGVSSSERYDDVHLERLGDPERRHELVECLEHTRERARQRRATPLHERHVQDRNLGRVHRADHR